jgi:hypothetical protein
MPLARKVSAEPSALGNVLGLFRRSGGETVKGDSVLGLSESSSRRALDRLGALQRADGSWDLTQELADVLGMSVSALRTISHGSGDADEAKRALATALAITFLERQASSNRGEWELLAAKATRWLAGVKAVPSGGESWRKLAHDLLI